MDYNPLLYGLVTGHFEGTVGADDAGPILKPMTGSIAFEPDLSYLLASSATPATVVGIDPTIGVLDELGDLRCNDALGVPLLATNDSGAGVTGYTYLVTPRLYLNGEVVPIKPFRIDAVAGSTRDFTTLIPVGQSGGVYLQQGGKGDKGDPGPAGPPGAPGALGNLVEDPAHPGLYLIVV